KIFKPFKPTLFKPPIPPVGREGAPPLRGLPPRPPGGGSRNFNFFHFNGLPFWPRSEENFTEMVGALGSGLNPRPGRRLVGDAPRLPVRAIPRFDGTVVLKWGNQAHALHARLTRTGAGVVVIETGGIEVQVILREWPMPTVCWRQRGIRTRFACP